MQTDLNYNWINGEKVILSETKDVMNPANGEVIGQVPNAGEKEAQQAIEAAHSAFSSWAALTPKERGSYLLAWADALVDSSDELAAILTEEQGKPLAEAKGEIEGCAEFLRWYAEEGKRVYGETIPGASANQRIMVIRQPVGVCALITPWNFPGAMIARKTAPALAAGCTVIAKPAGETPRIAIAIFEKLMETGIPKGVVNLITGHSSTIANVWLSDERVKKLSFTGSTEVGKQLMSQSSDQVKRISLELGGNAPVIVFPDANLDLAADAIVSNKFENCGQMCNGINVIFVHRDIQQQLTDKIVSRVQELTVGEGTADGVSIGPLINSGAVDNVEHLVADATIKGARVLTGGERRSGSGHFYTPTVLADVTKDMKMAHEEVFGPVAPILTFEKESDVISFTENDPYGLAAYFFTRDVSRVYRVSEKLDVGMVGVNGTQLSVPQAPFGGIKESGMGREGGHYGLDGFLELKYISLTLEDENEGGV